MADRYASFADLAAEATAGVDYRVRAVDRGSQAVILAPHAGTIEPGTGRIARAIAGEDLSLYVFEALGPGGFAAFHITSHRFDEPEALALLRRARRAVAIHGRRDDGSDGVWLGGRDTALRDAIGAALRGAGFAAAVNARLPGLHEANICNRTRSGAGVQLELPLCLRRELGADPGRCRAFAAAVREALRGGGPQARLTRT